MSPVLKCSVYAGLVAGTVDIAAASLINMVNPLVHPAGYRQWVAGQSRPFTVAVG